MNHLCTPCIFSRFAADDLKNKSESKENKKLTSSKIEISSMWNRYMNTIMKRKQLLFLEFLKIENHFNYSKVYNYGNISNYCTNKQSIDFNRHNERKIYRY